MYHDSGLKRSLVILSGAIFAILFASTALAAAPQFNSPAELNQAKPYSGAVKITDVFASKTVYGKLQGTTPVDIFSIVPDKDGTQQITLMGRKEKNGGQVALIFIDPTAATKPENLQLQMPSKEYHPSVLKQIEVTKTYREQFLSQDFNVYAQQSIALKKDITYYMVVVNADPSNPALHYAIKLGDTQTIQPSDVALHPISWLKLQSDVYGKATPFIFTIQSFGVLLLMLGLVVLGGILLIQDTFSFLANRSKAAGYLLIKLQPFSRIFIWIALWFMIIGGYMYFDRLGWVGIPFVLALLFIVIVANMLYQTLDISPKVSRLEVTKQEATIPFSLRKRYFLSSLVSLFSVGAFITYLSMYLSSK
jgi:hypothetical protein